MRRLRAGGSVFREDPDLDAAAARIFWRADVDPWLVRVDALAAGRDPAGAIDARKMGVPCVVLVGPAGERMLWRDGARHLRLALREGSFLNGPVRLRYALEGLAGLDHQLLTLRRFVGLNRLGRLPAILYPKDRRADHWIRLIRVMDALAAGASQREIAEVLFGLARTRSDWRGRSDYLRLRVQRLVRTALQLRDGGYLELLRTRPAI